MNNSESTRIYNRAKWDQIANQGNKYFLALTDEQIATARTGNLKFKVTPTQPVPTNWVGEIVGKRVLCLACGGGQQAPLFAAAGADVTVFDISEVQLQRDLDAAERHRLSIETVQGDMADMSSLNSNQFDLVVNPCSVCYCPDLKSVWMEASRVLKTGGRLICGFIKPINYLFDPVVMEEDQELRVCRKIPYSDWDLDKTEREQILGTERPIEFGHSLTDLMGSQIAAGLNIIGFYEDRWGDDDLLSDHIDVFAATLANKR